MKQPQHYHLGWKHLFSEADGQQKELFPHRIWEIVYGHITKDFSFKKPQKSTK